MPAPLSIDIRGRFIKAYDAEEGSLRDLALRFDIGSATATRGWTRWKETASVAARRPGGGNEPMLSSGDLDAIEGLVVADPALTIPELIEKFVSQGGRRVSPATMGRGLAKRQL